MIENANYKVIKFIDNEFELDVKLVQMKKLLNYFLKNQIFNLELNIT